MRASPRTVVGLLVVLVAFYLVLLGERGVLLVTSGQPLVVLLGVGVLLLPVVGAVLVVGEVRLGRASERLGRQLAQHPDAVLDAPLELPRRPSGRIDRAAADGVFEQRRAQVQAAPEDWRRWYRLAQAYGDAGDSSRGRAALRRAMALEARSR